MTDWRLVFGPDEPLTTHLQSISQEFEPGSALRLAVAWARDEGVCHLLSAIEGRVSGIEAIVGLNLRGTTLEAILRLREGGATVRVFFKHNRQTFHPKLYWFSEDFGTPQRSTVLVGSSNLTPGGLTSNFEMSMRYDLSPNAEDFEDDYGVLADVWTGLWDSPWAHPVSTDEDIQRLFEDGYLVRETTLRKARRNERGQTGVASHSLPTAPPTRVAPPDYPPVEIPFDVPEESAPAETEDPEGVAPLPSRFYVRTLTANDVAKLQGEQVGTFEPDLGEMARDRFPSFWGWPDEYQPVMRRRTRDEWAASGRLISSLSPPHGIPVNVMLWHREAREGTVEKQGHAAEHRIGLGPIGDIRAVVPAEFDTSSLLVVERASADTDGDFIVRLITLSDVGYEEFRQYLDVERPEHQFGYGH